MLERNMEDLLAKYPDDFFPGKGLKLLERQVTFSGTGRFDLLFSDTQQRRHLMELKAQPLKIADADQVARYRTALRERGEKRIILWLVSPRIPTHVRESLDDQGIEYAEIHVAQFKQVAEEHGLSIDEESASTRQIATPIEHEERGNIGVSMHDRIRAAAGQHRSFGHQQLYAVTRAHIGETLSSKELLALVLARFGTQLRAEHAQSRSGKSFDVWLTGKIMPSAHKPTKAKGDCTCAGFLESAGHGLYRVL